MVSTATSSTDILYFSFNQDQSCVAIGTQSGFKVYSTNPFKETISRDMGGGIGMVEMLYRCNIFALVGGGTTPKYPSNKVMLWDDHQTKCIAELSFKTDIKGLRLKSDKILVVLETKLYVYNFSDLKLIDHIETAKNSKGLFSLNNDPQTTILACLGKEPGFVAIHAYDTQKTISFRAHQSPVGAMELDYSGKRLATSSEKGTVIRIFDTEEGHFLHEVRRGSEYAQISSISFDPSCKWIACCSDTSTIHIFRLNGPQSEQVDAKKGDDNQNVSNPKSKFSFMKIVSSYFNSEWSFAQFKIPDRRAKLIFSKTTGETLHVLGFDGKFYNIKFDPVSGGEGKKEFEGEIAGVSNSQ